MRCPYCGNAVHESWDQDTQLVGFVDVEHEVAYEIQNMNCPSCFRSVVRMIQGEPRWAGVEPHEFLAGIDEEEDYEETILLPRIPCLADTSASVPAHITEDFEEAMIVLPFSPKASAALSRRCLQNILVDAGKVTKKDLIDQIEEASKAHGFTPALRRLLTAIRMVGNYAAHPLKDKATGNIVDVEPGEAELNISALESLIDFFYIKPVEDQAQLDEINKKLVAAGKPPIA